MSKKETEKQVNLDDSIDDETPENDNGMTEFSPV